ncbi:MAG TPA: FliG C-terminal domain-containing protein [Leptospiraceae bacterium]|nr:FliG C-terminal domain-containing protein [Leptospiraceae bacterium]
MPKEVLDKLDSKELQKLMEGLEDVKNPSLNEERQVLSTLDGLSSAKKNRSGYSDKKGTEKKYSTRLDYSSPLDSLKKKKRDELELIIRDEPERMIAMVMCFADPDEASHLIEDFPVSMRDKIIEEIRKVDFYSESLRAELESFLFFKYDLIESRMIVSKVTNRSGKKVAEILSRISPNLSSRMFSNIKEKDPGFAKSIDEYFYTFQDLLYIGRTSLTNFLAGFHPIVLACAMKGIDASLCEKIFERCEPWLVKQIKLELDSMGPTSLAEIEESQKAIIENLNRDIETGKVKLWKVK